VKAIFRLPASGCIQLAAMLAAILVAILIVSAAHVRKTHARATGRAFLGKGGRFLLKQRRFHGFAFSHGQARGDGYLQDPKLSSVASLSPRSTLGFGDTSPLQWWAQQQRGVSPPLNTHTR